MYKFGLGAVIALTFAVLAYAGLVAYRAHHRPVVAQATVQRTPQELAARARMARLVAEVAARTAAKTAREVAEQRLQQQAATTAAAPDKSVASASIAAMVVHRD